MVGCIGGGKGSQFLSVGGAKKRFTRYFDGCHKLFRNIALGPNDEVYLVCNTSFEDSPVSPSAL